MLADSTPVRDRRRWLHRLAVVADASASDRLRLAAIRCLQADMDPVNPLRQMRPETLLSQVLWPWHERMHKDKHGRVFEGLVLRPPQSLADLW